MASYAQLHTSMPAAFDYVHIVEYTIALVQLYVLLSLVRSLKSLR